MEEYRLNLATKYAPLFENKEDYTLREWGALVQNTADPDAKAALTFQAYDLWQAGKIKEIGPCIIVDQTKRPEYIKIVQPKDMPRKRGLDYMIHALAHVENVAIELSWDIALRYDQEKYKLPKQFFDDWVRVAMEESKHYSLLKQRLEKAYNKTYGDFPVHERLWEDALKTKDNLKNRLVLEHCIHEGRGIDVTHFLTIPRFDKDPETQKVLHDVILMEEITHVRDGLTWFKHICKEILEIKEEKDIVSKFHETVNEVLNGGLLQGPFMHELRAKAGMTEEYYMPIAKEEKEQTVKLSQKEKQDLQREHKAKIAREKAEKYEKLKQEQKQQKEEQE